MTAEELYAAAITQSDNAAANLLLRTMGGPNGLAAFIAHAPLNDKTTRLDCNEPSLNATTPAIRVIRRHPRMAHDLAILLTTKAACAASSLLLEGWMHKCKMGMSALRAGAPPQSYAGDKTGSGGTALATR